MVSRMLRFAVLAMCGVGAVCSAVGNQESSLPAESSWRVVIAPMFRLPQVTEPISGAKEVVIAAAWASEKDGAIRCMNQKDFDALGLDWKTFSGKTASAASLELAAVQPELIRDRREVLECIILRSKRPSDDITVAVLAPDFLARFTPLLGSKLLLAIPDRHTVFLFPKLVSHYRDYASKVLAIYRQSESPVSREVFELSSTGLRAIGAYEEP